jgi:tetraacyldisaccharide 4'-kinase
MQNDLPEKKHTLTRLFLLPFTLIYGFITCVRNLLFNLKILKEKEFSLPLISVGNITVGGTGKTPHIEYLISILTDQFNVAVLSRGYKRNTKNFLLVTNRSTYKEAGDEPKQIQKKYPGIKVAVDRKRVNGVNNLIKTFKNLDVILLDDAFQHRYIKPGLSILLVDYSRPLKNDLILPAGRLRERAIERKRAHIIIVTRCPADITPAKKERLRKELVLFPSQDIFFSTINYADLLPVFNKNEQQLSCDYCKKGKYNLLLVTGIANPQPLRNHLQSYFNNISEIRFPDHHAFNEKDIIKITSDFEKLPGNNKIILTTEKDAIRMQNFSNIAGFLAKVIYFIPIRVEFPGNQKDEFNRLIQYYVRENKRDNILLT